MVEGKEQSGIEAPDEREQFKQVLRQHRVRDDQAENIASYIAESSEGAVFEDPEALADKLGEFHDILDAVRRRRIVSHWFSKKGVEVPEEVLRGIVPEKQRAGAEREKELKRGIGEGRLWFVDTDKRGVPTLRPAKKDEPVMTLQEAQDAIRFMGGEEEAIVVFSDEQGRHVPNWKSDFVKKNPAAAWAAARAQDMAMASGEEQDPFKRMIDEMAKIEMLKTAIGGGTAVGALPSTVAEIFQGIRELDELRGGRTSGPEWASDPMQFLQTIQLVVQQMTPKVDSTASERIKMLEERLDAEREERRKAELARVAEQNVSLMNRVRDLEDEANKPRTATGATAADILGRLVDKIPGPGEVQKGFTEVARVIERGQQVTPRTLDQRREDLDSMEQNLTEDNELTKFENYWRFGVK